MIAVGVGARSGTGPHELSAAVRSVLDAAGIPGERVAVLATVHRRDDVVRIVASSHGWRFVAFTVPELAEVPVPTPSVAVAAAIGTPGVAEAAALLAAGPSSVLLVPKRIVGTATVAIARSSCEPDA
ncbi:cobalamin biosynthesis protein [Actinoplanes sp. NPDC023936]|uniref:cobalamin biosynthesis protein n=1 Tax=Actinoplanes sp. NPDC023936 TaxID=3154910 RepID=UPI0033D1AC6E